MDPTEIDDAILTALAETKGILQSREFVEIVAFIGKLAALWQVHAPVDAAIRARLGGLIAGGQVALHPNCSGERYSLVVPAGSR
jgi:hypothetical protein